MRVNPLLTVFFILILITGLGAGATTIPAGTVSSYQMNSASETYLLGGDVVATGTAIVGAADGITLDGMGHTITFGSESTGYGVLVNGKHNIEIYNVTILQTNSAVNNCYGIYIYGGNNADLHNVNINVTKSYAVYFRTETGGSLTHSDLVSLTGTPLYFNGDTDTTIQNNTIYAGTGYGSIVEASSGVVFDGNTITAPNNIGISIPTTSHHLTITNNTITSGSNVALRLLNTGNHTIADNTLQSTSNSGIYLGGTSGCVHNTIDGNTITSGSGIAAYFINSTYNQITDNEGTSTGNYGIYVRSSSNNVINNNIGRSTNEHGLVIAYGSHYNALSGNSGISTNKKGLFLFNVTGNTFTGTLISSPYCSWPATRSVAMFGDSITEGGQGGTVYGQLGGMIEDGIEDITGDEWTVQNRGFSGERAYQGRERFTQELDAFHNPNVVFIMYGTNDLLDSRPQQDIIDDILYMAGRAEARGLRTYILLTPAMYKNNNLRIQLNQNLSTQAASSGYNVINVYDAIDQVPNNGAFDAYNSSYYADGIHPNELGNTRITNYILYESELDMSDPLSQPAGPSQDEENNAEIINMLYMAMGILALVPVGLVGAALFQIMADGDTGISMKMIGGVTVAICVISLIMYSFTVIL